MGSYLSIVNNTPNTWQCKIGPDEAAIKIAGIAINVVAGAATVIATAGAAAPVVTLIAAAGGTSATVAGVSATALATVTAAAAAASGVTGAIGGVSSFGIEIAKGINDQLSSQGYDTIPSGQSHRYGKMSLSLWQQGTCVRTYIVDERTVRTETVYMRPIFSGGTDNSELKHEIQYWINKFGAEQSDVVAKASKQHKRMFREAKAAKEGVESDVVVKASGQHKRMFREAKAAKEGVESEDVESEDDESGDDESGDDESTDDEDVIYSSTFEL